MVDLIMMACMRESEHKSSFFQNSHGKMDVVVFQCVRYISSITLESEDYKEVFAAISFGNDTSK